LTPNLLLFINLPFYVIPLLYSNFEKISAITRKKTQENSVELSLVPLCLNR